MDEVELRLLREMVGPTRGEPGGLAIAESVVGVNLGDWGCLGKLAEWTGARHKKVVGLRIEAVVRGASPTVFWVGADISMVVFLGWWFDKSGRLLEGF
jgi:hypothetical protein